MALQGFDDLELVLGGHARVHGHFGRGLVERGLIGQLVELVAGQGLAILGDDAKVGGDAGGGQRVVAGDHHRADAGTMGLGHGVAHLGTRRIDNADHAIPDEIGFNGFGLIGDVGHLACSIDAYTGHISQRTGFQRTAGLAKRTVGLGGETFDGGENRLAIAFGELTDLTTHADARAVAQQHVGRALGEHGELV